jgi:hypothetical protein
MFDNVAFNVVIGLVFIYLLYSLLATVVAEIIATQLGIRARNLREAVDRMLSDTETKNGVMRFIDSLRLMKKPKNERINKFYNNPEIKYLGSTGIFKNPSSFQSETFSRTLLYELNGSGLLNKNDIEKELISLTVPTVKSPNPGNIGVSNNKERTLDVQSAQFVLSLFHYSNGDLAKFELHLQAWFDRTMEQATEWYKRKIQVVLMVIGFLMAWGFNAGTFSIIDKLSTDKDAREKMVSMATAYVQHYPSNSKDLSIDTNAKLDSLLDIKKKLDADINKANSILGSGSWLPDTVKASFDSNKDKMIYKPDIDGALLTGRSSDTTINGTEYYYSGRSKKISSFFYLVILHFWSFLITALAISLGAPFWFDLLNKIIQLRTSIKQPTDSTTATISVSPLNRIG